MNILFQIIINNLLIYKKWLFFVAILIIIDLGLLVSPKADWLKYLEYVTGLSIAIILTWLGSLVFDKSFENYLSMVAINKKINGELLVVVNTIADIVIFLLVFSIFAQTHHINIVAITASLGLGGIAIAFAAKQTLEQLFGGIVIYIDRPFIVDDYIGLADGTFGKVESIGLRSTKIRNSGKGTVTIIPNNSLAQMSIENFSGAKKIVTVIYLTFYRQVFEKEKALICQEILESSKDIFGIDARNTDISFTNFSSDNGSLITQAQVNFFILGSGQMSMDMRSQLLSLAKQNMMLKLRNHGIEFDIEEKSLNINSPISI